MEIFENNTKRILALIFVVALFLGLIKNDVLNTWEKLSTSLSEEDISMSTIESEYCSSLWKHRELIDLNGTMARIFGMQGLYADMGMYITDDNYIVSAYNYTSTDYEYEETISFDEFLSSNGINLLYVNEPTKYVDDSIFKDEFGVETYSNLNMDRFLSRIRERGVNTIDLRDNIKEENINVSDLFYRTDHHWTTEAGLWAAKIIADGLNQYCGYNIDTKIYNKENYIFNKWESCWLGEQGRKVGETYVGLDDYIEIKPNYTTSYTFKSEDGTTYEGTFDNFINEDLYNLENDVYENGSWHYSYTQINCINNNVSHGKILILGDSYEQVTEPFLSLGVHEVDAMILRSADSDFSLRNYILENNYDTVLICYAQFMVGAHDDETSANYKMFSFAY